MKRNSFLFFLLCFIALRAFPGGGSEITIPADAESKLLITIPPNDGNKLSNGGKIKIMRYIELPPEAKTRSENMKYVAFDVLIDNSNGRTDIAFMASESPFLLRDSNGFEYPAKLFSRDIIKPAFTNSDIGQGDLLRGWITYEVPLGITLNDLRIRLVADNYSLKIPTVTSGWTTFSGF